MYSVFYDDVSCSYFFYSVFGTGGSHDEETRQGVLMIVIDGFFSLQILRPELRRFDQTA